MLAALGQVFHWPRAELEALTAEDAMWWHDAARDLMQRQAKRQE
jgi:hypothetical protein